MGGDKDDDVTDVGADAADQDEIKTEVDGKEVPGWPDKGSNR